MSAVVALARRLPPGPWLARWIVVPALLGGLVGANVDLTAPPVSGPERLVGVFLTDGEAYYGHLEDPLGTESVVLRDVYYFQQANSALGLPVALVRRGTEIHNPADGMRIRRDKILAVERVGARSPVADAIAADRVVGTAP